MLSCQSIVSENSVSVFAVTEDMFEIQFSKYVTFPSFPLSPFSINMPKQKTLSDLKHHQIKG